ncbi:MAG: hypothetical protein LJE67_04775 [Salaquimonas sp.]|jgi:hypothetical protein|nr:hypothetical protein [Salaquimonas sp.]
MNKRLGKLVTLGVAAIVIGSASPAKAISVYNCSPVNLRLKFYNEFDPIELVAKRQINVRAGAAAKGVFIPGFGTHKVKIYNQSSGGQLLITLKKVNGRLSYVLFINPDGTLGMVTGNGCGVPAN